MILAFSTWLQAATYTSPQQLNLNDVYQLNADGATGDEATTEPKTDLNNGQNGDNPYFQRTNVARAHLGGCSGRYWYTSSYQEAGEPDPAGPQYVDYIPPFGAASSQLTPGRYRLNAEYRFTDSRATYPAEYIVNGTSGTTTVLKSQRDGTVGSCPEFDIGEFDLGPGSYIRVNDSGTSSITFNRMLFTYIGPLGGVPYVNAGLDQTVVLPAAANLDGTAVDSDALPNPLTVTWTMTSGPGTVTFGDANAVDTTASFSVEGTYVLRLTANDGLNVPFDEVTITVLPLGSCQLEVLENCGTTRQTGTPTVLRSYPQQYPGALIKPAEFTLVNQGATAIAYTVTEVTNATNLTPLDYAWLEVANPTGTIPPLSSVVVTVTFNSVGLTMPASTTGAQVNAGALAFAEGTCSMATITRRVRVNALGTDATSVHEYNGDVDPTTDSSAGEPGSGYNFVIQEGSNQGSFENDADAVDGKAWRIIDSASAKTKYRAARLAPLPDPEVFTRSGATVVARVKVRSHSDPRGGALILWDGELSAEYHWGDNGLDGVITEMNRGNTTTLTNGFDQNFHILRMTAIGDADCNRIVRFYFDEDVSPVAVLTIPNAVLKSGYGGAEGLGFGAGSTDGSYDIAFDWVTLTNAGAFAPGEENAVLGRSLVVGRNCNTPCVDIDGDGYVDMDDFAGLQRCLNPLIVEAGCECFDNMNPRGKIDEFDVNYFVKCASGPDLRWTASLDCPN
jgi:hypothetical protein